MCGPSSSSPPLRQRSKAGALFAGVNKRGNGALGSRLKWVMKQVCTEASNESFAGNFGFYEEKKDEEEDKKEWDQLRAQKKMAFHMKRKESKRAAAVKCFRGSFSVLPQCEDKRLECIKLTGSPNPPTSTAAAAVCEPWWPVVNLQRWLLMLWQVCTFEQSWCARGL